MVWAKFVCRLRVVCRCLTGGLRMASGWRVDCPRVVCGWVAVGLWMASRWYVGGVRSIRGWSLDGLRMVCGWFADVRGLFRGGEELLSDRGLAVRSRRALALLETALACARRARRAPERLTYRNTAPHTDSVTKRSPRGWCAPAHVALGPPCPNHCVARLSAGSS